MSALTAIIRASTRLTLEADLDRIFALLRTFLGAEAVEQDMRVGAMVTRLSRALGVSEKHAEVLGRAARLHDIGKLAIRASILFKPTELTAAEMEIVRRHPLVGASMLDNPAVPFFVLAQIMAKSHHEHWNGSGYPTGLQREAIPALARMVSLCDVYDCLLHARPYKQAWPQPKVIRAISDLAGIELDPYLVEVFLDMLSYGG